MMVVEEGCTGFGSELMLVIFELCYGLGDGELESAAASPYTAERIGLVNFSSFQSLYLKDAREAATIVITCVQSTGSVAWVHP